MKRSIGNIVCLAAILAFCLIGKVLNILAIPTAQYYFIVITVILLILLNVVFAIRKK